MAGELSAADTVAEIMWSMDLCIRSEQTCFEDIRLTEQLLASTDITQIASQGGSPSIATLLADLGRVADNVRRTFETYSITPEQLSLKIDSLDQSQLATFTRQAMTQLWEDVDSRGWTALPNSKPVTTTRADVAPELPPDLHEIFSTAPPEQTNAANRLLKILSSQGLGNLIGMTSLILAVIISIDTSNNKLNSQSDANSSVEVNVSNTQGDVDINVVNNSTANARSEVLDVINEDPAAQAEAAQLLREIRDALNEDSDNLGASDCTPSDDDTSSRQ